MGSSKRLLQRERWRSHPVTSENLDVWRKNFSFLKSKINSILCKLKVLISLKSSLTLINLKLIVKTKYYTVYTCQFVKCFINHIKLVNFVGVAKIVM